MKLDLIDLGARVRGGNVTFRAWLPGLEPDARVLAVGSFCDWEPEKSTALKYDTKKDIWEGVAEDVPQGRHEYAYLIKTGSWYSNPANDPYAKMTGGSGFSAFQVPPDKPARLDSFDAPPLDELVLYELDLDDFNRNFDGVRNRITYYLGQLGVNGVVISPLVGFDRSAGGERIPVNYFAPDSTYGTPYELKVMINQLHRARMAVIMDIDLLGVSPSFGICEMYPLFESKPMLARLDESGKRVYFNFTDESAREFVYGVCRFWLDEMGVDGFRFLNSRGFWDGSEGDALAGLCKRLHQLRRREGREIYLFACDCSVLDQEMLNRSALNGVSNSRFQGAIQRMSENRTLEGDFWKTMDLHQLNYSDESMVEKELVQKSALNSCEGTGTHSLIVKMGVLSGQKDLWGNPVGDRKNHWWKVKPYIISQFTATGIPVIYNGQEIGENRYLPEPGPGRYAPRPLNWHYLADFAGKDLFRFHQKLIHLRHKFKAIRSRNFYHYFTDTEHQVLVFKRYQDDEQIVVAVNFGNESCEVLVPFPSDGYWHEYLDDYDVEVLGRQAVVKVPARYGVIFFRE